MSSRFETIFSVGNSIIASKTFDNKLNTGTPPVSEIISGSIIILKYSKIIIITRNVKLVASFATFVFCFIKIVKNNNDRKK